MTMSACVCKERRSTGYGIVSEEGTQMCTKLRSAQAKFTVRPVAVADSNGCYIIPHDSTLARKIQQLVQNEIVNERVHRLIGHQILVVNQLNRPAAMLLVGQLQARKLDTWNSQTGCALRSYQSLSSVPSIWPSSHRWSFQGLLIGNTVGTQSSGQI